MKLSIQKHNSIFLNRKVLNLIIVLSLLLAVMLLNIVMIRDGLNGMTDLKWHITWLQHFSQQLGSGIWYPRWLAGTNYGYGSPTFVFYPPLVYYLGSGFKFIGLTTENTITCLFSLALFLSGLNFYFFGSKIWGKLPSLIGSLFYMSTPYLAFDIYYRSGLSSIFVQAWIPLLLLTTRQTLAKPKNAIWLAFSWLLIALTHTPSLLLCSIVYFLYLALLLPKKGWHNISTLIFATLCGWGMASIYLIPAILEKSFVNINSLKEVHGGFKDALIGTSLPLFPLDLENLVNVPYIFLHQSIAIILLAVIAAIGLKNQKFLKSYLAIWIAIAMILAFLMTGLSYVIWESSSILQMVQFPWRFLQFFSAIGAIMFAAAVQTAIQVKRTSVKIILLLIMIFLLLANYKYWHQLSRNFITLNYTGKGNTEHLNHIKKALNSPYDNNLRDVPEYRPLLDVISDNPPQPKMGQPELSVLAGKANFELKTWESYLREFAVKANTKSTIRIRTYYYPAWQLYINNSLSSIRKHTDGTIAFDLAPGTYQIKLIYSMTKALLLGITCSGFSFICLLFYRLRG